MIGQQIENYRILAKLGEGAMGVVYKAMDVNLERVVALKLMNAGLSHHPDLEARFRAEARTQATLNHHNIATLFSFLTWESKAVMVMEFVDGKTLQQMVGERGALSPVTALALCKQALYGVGAAHRQGIVHRDLKPANLMLSNDGVVKVMDFGIAKIKGGGGLKGTAMAIGTYDYMAPEQALNQHVDGRTDIYSMGITLYELLTGDVPFTGTSELAVQMAHLNDRPRNPTERNPEIPQSVADVVLKALQKNPDDRFATTEEFIRALPRLSDASGQVPRQVQPERGTVIDTGGFGGVQAPYGVEARQQSWPPPPMDASQRPVQQPVAPQQAARLEAAADRPAVQPQQHMAVAQLQDRDKLQDRDQLQKGDQPKKSNTGALLGGVAAAVVLAALVGGWLISKPKHTDPTPQKPETEVAQSTQAANPGGAGAPVTGTAEGGKQPVAATPPVAVAKALPVAKPAAAPVKPKPNAAPVVPVDPAPAPAGDLVGEWMGSYKDSATQETTPVTVDLTAQGSDGKLSGSAAFTLDNQKTQCSVSGSKYDATARELRLVYTSCKGSRRPYLNLPTTFKGVDPAAKVVTSGSVMTQPTESVALVKHRF